MFIPLISSLKISKFEFGIFDIETWKSMFTIDFCFEILCIPKANITTQIWN